MKGALSGVAVCLGVFWALGVGLMSVCQGGWSNGEAVEYVISVGVLCDLFNVIL